MTKRAKTGVTFFDLEEGELFAFGYSPNDKYRFMRLTEDSNYAIVRAQRAGADDENANPYYNDIIRENGPVETNKHLNRGGA